MGKLQKNNINISELFQDLLMAGPFGWALIRVQEAYLLSQFKFTHPVLDLACGDGTFAKVLLKYQRDKRYDVGVDVDAKELQKAKKSRSYRKLVQANAAHLPFKNDTFATVFSNGSIEHFDNFDQCLSELERVLKKGGYCYLTVPTGAIGQYLFFPRILRFMKLDVIADTYVSFFNKLFRHKNLFNHLIWKRKLKQHKLLLDSFVYYNYDPVMPSHDIMLWLNAWNFIIKRMTGNWFLIPGMRKLTSPIEKLLFKGLINIQNEARMGPSLLLIIKK